MTDFDESGIEDRAGTQTRIGDYGLLGDTRTAALVSGDGSLDWLCVPRFDGDPVFGRLVGGAPAGRFRLGPEGHATVVRRRYRTHTATLETTWDLGNTRLTLSEAMIAEVAGRLLPATVLVRRLSVEGETARAVVEFDPRLGERHRPRRCGAVPTSCASGARSPCPWPATPAPRSRRAGRPRSS
ncbi:trehalase-like domain-containing protein [Rhodococcus aetherivorans]|uniref:trehalase-like domain-containing protein n=1 Tax=Rhodococcus aetherivorans TaxID=191292 RepID=UPI001F2298D3|nr:trehalase-like domain-containing protein [Rhodococcus aetherivorans]